MEPIYRLIDAFKHYRARSSRHFSVLRDSVTRDNLLTLRRAVGVFEAFLLLYGLWTARAFHSSILSRLYLVFLALNTILLVFALRCDKHHAPKFRSVQVGCMLSIALVMAFTISVSIFPFPDRPSIFFPLAYAIVILLYQIPRLQLSLILTAATALFIALAYLVKDVYAYVYDIFSAVTTWLVGFFFIFVISDLHLRNGESRMELDLQCHTDPLTGLPNRRGLDSFVSVTYRRCIAAHYPLAVIMLDIDHFKVVNDRFGHLAGDRCLKLLSKELYDLTHDTGFFAARYGGEEFVLLLPGCGEEEASRFGLDMLAKLPFPGPDGKNVTVSLGVAAEMPQPGDTFAALLERADRALYRAKNQGRNCLVLDHVNQV